MCIHTTEELAALIREIGFLPLFSNEITGFSVEERTEVHNWWSGDPEKNPWEWRWVLGGRDDIAYGKFFNRKVGFGKHEKKYWIILKRMESSCPSKERNRKGPDDQNM